MGRRAFRARSLFRWIVLGVCCCLALSAILVFRVPLGDELRLAVMHRPSLYTALSFVEPEGGSMPLSTRRANTIVFRIANHEGGDVSYSYSVSLASRFGSLTASRGRVEIPEDGETTREIDLVVSRRHTAYVVSVVLEGRGDSIELHAVTQ